MGSRTGKLGATTTAYPPQMASPLPTASPPPQASSPRRRGSNNTTVRQHPKSLLALGASVLLVLLTVVLWAFLPAGTPYTTAIGGYQRIVLDDGSVLQLNTNTKLRVALTEVERRVQLDHGEAYFEVTHDVARPFIVRAGRRRIVAVGTQFSVRLESGDVRVSVTEGTVRLAGDELVGEEGRAGPEAPETSRTPDAGADPRRMHAGEAVLLPAGTIVRIASAGTARVEHHPLPEVESQLTWRTGILVFHNQPLGEVVTEINRYNRRHFVIADPALATLSFGGNLKPTDPQSLIDALRTLDIQADDGPNTVILRHHSP
jgi:transmembrane sensor